MGNVQLLQLTSSPIRAIANEDLPTPVEPRMIIRGLGSAKNIPSYIKFTYTVILIQKHECNLQTTGQL